MIQMAGRLSVRQIKGRKGMFAVGDLTTEVGTFKVKDPILDQFDEGEYRGLFQVTRIYPDSYIYFGRVVTEVRATLAGIELEHEEIKPAAADIPAEPDPAEREVAPPAPTGQPAGAKDALATQAPPDAEPERDSNPDLALFGPELYDLVQSGGDVKLDPTVDRTVFRQQRDRLKVLGYGFDAATQSWSRKQ